jgi:hypothetical protein
VRCVQAVGGDATPELRLQTQSSGRTLLPVGWPRARLQVTGGMGAAPPWLLWCEVVAAVLWLGGGTSVLPVQ